MGAKFSYVFLVGFLIGFIAGGWVCYHGGDVRWQKKCIQAGVAEWQCDPKTGDPAFVFKEPT